MSEKIKLCGPRKNPYVDTWTKPELIELAMEKFGFERKELSRKTISELCELLHSYVKQDEYDVAHTHKQNISNLTYDTDVAQESLIPLKDHQLALVDFLSTHRGVIAMFNVGSGKTLAAIAAAECWIRSKSYRNVVVVVPTSLKENFIDNCNAYGISDSSRYTLLTYQKFANSNIRLSRNDFLIIDEAHNLRTHFTKDSTSRAKILVDASKDAGKVLLLSASIIQNRPYDIINLIAMVKGDDPIQHYEFDMIMHSRKAFYDYLGECVLFHDKGVGEGYPRFSEKDIIIEMNKEYYNMYREIETKVNEQFGDNPWVFYTGMRQATNGLPNNPKVSWTYKKILEGKKTVVYSAFLTYGIKQIQRVLKTDGIKFYEIVGDMTSKQRGNTVNAFNADPDGILFITKAGKEGIDLKGVRYLIIYETNWNISEEDQIKGRAIRFMSHTHLPYDEQHVTVYHLILKKKEQYNREIDSADIILRKIMAEKFIETETFLRRLREISEEV